MITKETPLPSHMDECPNDLGRDYRGPAPASWCLFIREGPGFKGDPGHNIPPLLYISDLCREREKGSNMHMV